MCRTPGGGGSGDCAADGAAAGRGVLIGRGRLRLGWRLRCGGLLKLKSIGRRRRGRLRCAGGSGGESERERLREEGTKLGQPTPGLRRQAAGEGSKGWELRSCRQ